MVLFRVIVTQSESGVRHIEFEGSLAALQSRFPVDQYPTPLNRHVEDICQGRGGSLIFSVQRSEMPPGSALAKELPWEPVAADPRF
jgi:hypothetical protein